MSIAESLARLIGRLQARKTAYQLAFGSPAGKSVAKDLARFCRAGETCFNTDPRLEAMLEGRRQVWLRIEQHINFSPGELAVIYRAAVLDQTGDDNG